jgi:hypothetical protein
MRSLTTQASSIINVNAIEPTSSTRRPSLGARWYTAEPTPIAPTPAIAAATSGAGTAARSRARHQRRPSTSATSRKPRLLSTSPALASPPSARSSA